MTDVFSSWRWRSFHAQIVIWYRPKNAQKLESNNGLSDEGDVNWLFVFGATVREFIYALGDIGVIVVMQTAFSIHLVRVLSVSQYNWSASNYISCC